MKKKDKKIVKKLGILALIYLGYKAITKPKQSVDLFDQNYHDNGGYGGGKPTENPPI